MMKIDAPNKMGYTFFLVMALISSSQMSNPYAFLVTCLALVCLTFLQKETLPRSYFLFTILVFGISLLGMIFELNAEVVTRILMTCALIPLVFLIDLRKHPQALDFATKFMGLSLALAIIGFLYALAGGADLFRLINPDGRELLLFLSTFSNSNFPIGGGHIIRPSFIFDEPGAYTFAIDTILLINLMVYRKLRGIDWFLIIGGLITFSIAHILVCCLIVFAARKSKLLFIPACAISGIDYLLYLSSGVSQIIDRFTVVDGALAGDNRSKLFERAFDLVVEHPYGMGGICNWDISSCFDIYGGFGENPAFPAAYYGIMAASAYYLIFFIIVSLIVISALKLNRFWMLTSLAILALIAQRPFLFNIGYNLQILLIFSMLLKTITLKKTPVATNDKH
ncbi:hypothetical protein QN363_17595 [Undibacterium sp. CCC2.1]|uniref:hypothetical protein n=1 Tax=unclassified Undibacterium TaxID=2630295 RepID=UPI002B22F84F|nr:MULTISPECIES: hypothetical protein [unclassified Undibacterium]MEB0140844.1 hypothetical protein [Undibacterium sp. CCC2.1]MEB0173811.1 hypothetical protein [Undibacterium sp. CCC1.1]MEB0177795.1 hypothetical protein [Undibacterium sp. CCC3.4]